MPIDTQANYENNTGQYPMSINDFDRVTLRNRSHEMVTEDMHKMNNTTYSAEIHRNADKISVTHIIFKLHNPDMSIGEFKERLNDSLFTVAFNSTIVYQYHLSFLSEIENVVKIGTDIVIKLPNYLIREFILISMQYTGVKISIDNINTELFDNVRVMKEYLYQDSEERRETAQVGHEQFIQQIQTHKVSCDVEGVSENNSITKVNHLSFNQVVKGYFIECDKLNNLDNVSLSYNDIDRFNYGRNELNDIGIKVSNNLLYLPFSPNQHYNISNMNSFQGGSNHSNIDSIKLRTTFSDVQNSFDFKIHAISSNIIRIMSGMAGVAYSNFSYTHIDIHVPAPIPTVIPTPTQPYVSPNTQFINSFVPEYRKLEKDALCAISLDDITDHYGMCSTCKNCFDFDSISKWLKSKRSCPMCRSEWVNTIKYINSVEPDAIEEVEEVEEVDNNVVTTGAINDDDMLELNDEEIELEQEPIVNNKKSLFQRIFA